MSGSWELDRGLADEDEQEIQLQVALHQVLP